jgi:hypothetical protein
VVLGGLTITTCVKEIYPANGSRLQPLTSRDEERLTANAHSRRPPVGRIANGASRAAGNMDDRKLWTK